MASPEANKAKVSFDEGTTKHFCTVGLLLWVFFGIKIMRTPTESVCELTCFDATLTSKRQGDLPHSTRPNKVVVGMVWSNELKQGDKLSAMPHVRDQ